MAASSPVICLIIGFQLLYIFHILLLYTYMLIADDYFLRYDAYEYVHID